MESIKRGIWVGDVSTVCKQKKLPVDLHAFAKLVIGHPLQCHVSDKVLVLDRNGWGELARSQTGCFFELHSVEWAFLYSIVKSAVRCKVI